MEGESSDRGHVRAPVGGGGGVVPQLPCYCCYSNRAELETALASIRPPQALWSKGDLGPSTGVKRRGKINRLKKQTDLSFSFRENKLSIPFHEGQKRSRDEEGQGEVGARLRPTPQRDGQVAQAGQGPMRRPEEEEGRDSVSVRYDQTEER
ncbi:hypothetical protein JOQ06_019851 [Pogonophryne albipinna]|uniref:Uncharacterized protein n=1 Tax=Pogonophryne albipinna TaxID=1090488 RepID=A0AAD6BS00_9TELE|nr:hypothetical protein JOQ06_019851 [Pogonophryne albipinna]